MGRYFNPICRTWERESHLLPPSAGWSSPPVLCSSPPAPLLQRSAYFWQWYTAWKQSHVYIKALKYRYKTCIAFLYAFCWINPGKAQWPDIIQNKTLRRFFFQDRFKWISCDIRCNLSSGSYLAFCLSAEPPSPGHMWPWWEIKLSLDLDDINGFLGVIETTGLLSMVWIWKCVQKYCIPHLSLSSLSSIFFLSFTASIVSSNAASFSYI